MCLIYIQNVIVYTFLESRQKNGQRDKFSVILYGASTKLVCERRELTHNFDCRNFIQSCIDVSRFGGNTLFGEAIFAAQNVMEKTKDDHFILMFLTDGWGSDDCAIHDPSITASQRVCKLKHDYKNFSFYGIQFGGGQHSQALINMAKQGGNHPIKDATMPNDLGNFFITAVAKEIDVSLMHNIGR